MKKFRAISLAISGLALFLGACRAASPAVPAQQQAKTAIFPEASRLTQIASSTLEPTEADLLTVIPQTNKNEPVRMKDNMPLILIPEGEFPMGCDPEFNAESDCFPDELPLHTVWLDSFYIDKFEVSNAQYLLCEESHACTALHYLNSATHPDYHLSVEFADYPVVAVNWEQADAYCKWVGGSLPTEAQWEKAARGPQMRAFPWGNEPADCTRANYNSSTEGRCVGDLAAVGSYPAGASFYGVMDMAGNAWEWTSDWYNSFYYKDSPYKNPTGPGEGFRKIIKGGAWDYTELMMLTAYNSDHAVGEEKLTFGFRCVMDQLP